MLILGLFFSNIGKEYYFREIARFLDKKPGVFQRDLNKLEEKGIIKSKYKGNQRYFNLNKNYSFYKELKSIVFKTTGMYGQLKKIVNNFPKIKKAFLFGSFAFDNTDQLSDVDVLIIGSINMERFSYKIKLLEKKTDREINYIIYSEKEYREKLEKKDSFLLNVLNKNIVLKND